MALEEEGHRMGSGRVPRGRGCNESFRAAVDRSYDVPLTGLRNKMETRKCHSSKSCKRFFVQRYNQLEVYLDFSYEFKNVV